MAGKIKKIADTVGVSESTVKRALSNCPGVSSDTREKVITMAGSEGVNKSSKGADVAVILPSVPSNFWCVLSKHIYEYANSKNISVRTLYFGDINCDENAVGCIDIALNARIDRFILSVPFTETMLNKLDSMPKGTRCVFLEEYIDTSNIDNSCFVGEDSYKEGYELACRYIKKFKDSKRFLIYNSKVGLSHKRIEGFVAALIDEGKSSVQLNITDIKTNAKSAVFAREFVQHDDVDCIYAPTGSAIMVDLAVNKLKKKTHIIGFDGVGKNYSNNVKFIVNQDLKAQAIASVDAVMNNTMTAKSIFIPSKLVIERE